MEYTKNQKLARIDFIEEIFFIEEGFMIEDKHKFLLNKIPCYKKVLDEYPNDTLWFFNSNLGNPYKWKRCWSIGFKNGNGSLSRASNSRRLDDDQFRQELIKLFDVFNTRK